MCVKELAVTYVCGQGCGPLAIHLIHQWDLYRLGRAVSVKEQGSLFKHV